MGSLTERFAMRGVKSLIELDSRERDLRSALEPPTRLAEHVSERANAIVTLGPIVDKRAVSSLIG